MPKPEPKPALDFVIRGAGLSGLTLAVALIEAFPTCRMLLVDPGRAKLDRTFGFWWVGPPPFAATRSRPATQHGVGRPAARDRMDARAGPARLAARSGLTHGT
jgi:hypothetical protein